MIILKNTTEPQDVMIQRPNPDNEVERNVYLKSSDLKTLNDESLVGQGNISIPVVTKTSDLINDSGYLTEHQSLEEYYTKTQTDTKLNDYAKKTDIPTKVSQLENDRGYIDSTALTPYALKTEVPTKTSQLTNDSGYLTEHQSLEEYYTKTQTDTKLNELKTDIPTKTSQLTNDSDYTTKSYVDSSISTALGTIETKLSTI